jgi:hypothetical protein
MFRSAALVFAILAATPLTPARKGEAPTPETFFGYRLGAEGRLPTWDQTAAYLRVIDAASTRVAVEELGRTTEGRPFLLATIAATDNAADRRAAREAQRRLADPRVTTPEEASRLADTGKAVVLLGAGIHSNETGGTPALLEVVWQLATDRSPQTDHVLRNLIVLVVPSQNPDGQQRMAEWVAANAGTPYEGAPLPDLYHRYAGHDNNRDAFMQTQVETRLVSRVLYHDWRPEVFHDLHQMGPSRARIFVPPYRSPVNPNIDPLVWTGTNLLGQTMASRLLSEGKTGVLWGETYNGYWQGANSTTPWWHNVLGVLSEVASARMATSVVQEPARPAPGSLAPARPRAGGTAQLPPPSDVQYRANYPEPWLGGPWTPRDVIDYHLSAVFGLLEGVANNRAGVKRQFHTMQRRTVERFAAGGPWGYHVPAEQHDPSALAEFVRVLSAGGAEMESVARESGPARPGDLLVRLAQPDGRWIKDLLEAQVYPEPAARIERPYDITAWTLGLQLGLDVRRLDVPLQVETTPLDIARFRDGGVKGRGDAFVAPRESNASVTLVNRLWTSGARIGSTREPVELSDETLAAGAFVITGIDRPAMQRHATAAGVTVRAVPADLVPSISPLRRPRVAVLEPWGGAIDAGWTRWVLERHAFQYVHLRPTALQAAEALDGLDVVIVPDVPIRDLMRGTTGSHVRPEHRGGLDERGVGSLKRFVHAGGIVVTLGNAGEFALDHLDVPASIAVRSDVADITFVPGSLLSARSHPGHPVARGLPGDLTVMSVMNHGYAPARGGESVQPIVRYGGTPLLKSGYATGEARLQGMLAAFDAPIGRGRVVVLGFRVQHRAQTLSTFKLLFNAILLGGEALPPEPLTAGQ